MIIENAFERDIKGIIENMSIQDMEETIKSIEDWNDDEILKLILFANYAVVKAINNNVSEKETKPIYKLLQTASLLAECTNMNKYPEQLYHFDNLRITLQTYSNFSNLNNIELYHNEFHEDLN